MKFLCIGFENLYSYIVQVRFDIRRTLIFVVIGPMCPSISCCELCDIVLLSSAKETFKNHDRKNINKTHYMLIINGMLKKKKRHIERLLTNSGPRWHVRQEEGNISTLRSQIHSSVTEGGNNRTEECSLVTAAAPTEVSADLHRSSC